MKEDFFVVKKTQNHHLVNKHNELVEAKYRLSLQEQRLIAFMAAEIKPDDQDFKPYKFVVKDFAELLGLPKDRYYTELKKVTRSLLNRTLTIKKEKSLLQINWLSSAEYFEREGYVELCFDPKLKPYLLQLKKCFTQYQLGEILRLRSKYAFRLYELCKKNELLGKYKYEIDELREKLGVEKGELKQWIHLKQRCIEPAVKEINKKTDLKVRYSTEKLGRRIKWIIFNINRNKNKKNLKEIDNNIPIDKLIKLIPEKERKKKTIQSAVIKAYKRHGIEYCKRNIEYATQKATDNYRVFLIKALKEDWALGWWEDKIQEQKQKQEQEKQKQQEYQKFLERIKPYVGKNVRIATISALVGVLQKDGSLKIETSKGDRIISADDIQKFLRENDVIEEWDIKEDKEENREENKKINVKYTINTIKNKKVEIEGKVYKINRDGSVTTEKETITRGKLFVMLCANMAKLLE